jgi:2-oxoglutarate ferredoxin oxidoreductase subunit delta
MSEKSDKSLHINEEKCKACGLCIKFCPAKALVFKDSFNADGFHPVACNKDKCNLCGICYMVCPDCVIEIY